MGQLLLVLSVYAPLAAAGVLCLCTTSCCTTLQLQLIDLNMVHRTHLNVLILCCWFLIDCCGCVGCPARVKCLVVNIVCIQVPCTLYWWQKAWEGLFQLHQSCWSHQFHLDWLCVWDNFQLHLCSCVSVSLSIAGLQFPTHITSFSHLEWVCELAYVHVCVCVCLCAQAQTQDSCCLPVARL